MSEPIASSSNALAIIEDHEIEPELEPAEYVTTVNGKRKIVRCGYAYIAELHRGKKKYWRCARRSSTCKARIHTIEDNIVNVIGEHNHLPDPGMVKVLNALNQIKQNAVTSPLPVNEIVATSIAALDPVIASQLPNRDAIRRSIHRIRQKTAVLGNGVNLTSPESIHSLGIPEMYKVTATGEDFLLFDSGIDSEARILIFSTHQNLNFLGASNQWMADASFQMVPDIFSHLFTLLAIHGGKAVPLVFIVMPNDSPETYRHALDMLLLLQPEMNPQFISVEFDSKYISILREKFPQARIIARLYHLCQLIFKRVQLEGLQEKYQNDLNFSIQIRMLAALAFVPLHQVRDMFEQLLDTFPKEAVNILGYFEDTFIGRYRKTLGQDEAIFPMSLWNLHDTISEDTIISNNLIDSWQQSLSVLFANQKLTLWKFLKCLQDCQGTTRNVVEQLMNGVPPKSALKKRGSQECQKFIMSTVQKYNSLEPLTFLQLIASNIGR